MLIINKKIMIEKIAVFIVICLLSLSVSGCSASDSDEKGQQYSLADIQSESEVESFVRKFILDVNNNNAKSIANYLYYPLGVYIKGNPTVINNRAEFVTNYSEIFTKGVKAAIACQNVEQLGVQTTGVMIGQGEVWISKASQDEKDDSLKITKINNRSWPKERGRKDASCYFEFLSSAKE